MSKVISIRFKPDGKEYYFDPVDKIYSVGEMVVVTTSKGTECATVSKANHEVPESLIIKPLCKVERRANENDLKKLEQNKEKAKKAYSVCEEKIIEHGLDMKLVDVEVSFDSNKMTFCFTSDGRVDFRELVKDLAATFHTRIELRQIGVRDEAKMLGGLGICGQPFCCSRFLDDFQPVSIKMAKEQGLSLNPTKISGCCGRLMCCLKYEQDAYEYLIKTTPKKGSTVITNDGEGTVLDVNLLKGNLMIRVGEDGIPTKYHKSEVRFKKQFKPESEKKEAEENENQ